MLFVVHLCQKLLLSAFTAQKMSDELPDGETLEIKKLLRMSSAKNQLHGNIHLGLASQNSLDLHTESVFQILFSLAFNHFYCTI